MKWIPYVPRGCGTVKIGAYQHLGIRDAAVPFICIPTFEDTVEEATDKAKGTVQVHTHIHMTNCAQKNLKTFTCTVFLFH